MGPIWAVVSLAVNFFSSPLGKWAGIGLIGAMLFFAGDIRGRRIQHAKCEAAAAKAQQAANQQDANARQEVAKQSEDTINALRGQKEEADGKLAQLELQLRGLPLDAPCLYGAGGKPASSRVRNDEKSGAGTSNPGPARPAGVPAAR